MSRIGMADELAAQLETQLGRDVTGLRRLSGGASRETWSFELAQSDHGPPQRLVLQRRLGTGPDSSPAPSETEQPAASRLAVPDRTLDEGAVLQVAFDSGVPVAPLVARSGSAVPVVGGLAGEWIICEHIDGETIPRRILRDEQFAAARSRLLGDCGAALARIHRIDVSKFAVTPTVLTEADVIANLRETLDVMGEAHPVFELGLRWLELHPPPRRSPVVVHGDFRTGNLLVTTEGLGAVLDWELSHLGNPIADLGWFCARPWRFGSPHRAGGFGSVEELLASYADELERTPGPRPVPVASTELEWWELLAVLRWGVICVVQAQAHLSGAVRSVELAAIGRRACEAEWDALTLLHRLVGDGPTAELGPTVHDRPTSSELVESVREFLESEVLDATTGSVRYRTRVAIRSLQIVERELNTSEREPGGHNDVGTVATIEVPSARSIRLGDHDRDLAALIRGARATTSAKLRVANPTYAEGE